MELKTKNNYTTVEPEDIYDPDNGNAIVAKDLVKKFGDITAVDDLSLEVKEGEIFGNWKRIWKDHTFWRNLFLISEINAIILLCMVFQQSHQR